MAIANSYPMGTVKTADLILGTSVAVAGTNDKPTTRNFSVSEVLALGSAPNVVTTTFTVTNAQLRTLGTAPVEILPGVTGYSYQILGLTTTVINSGTIGDAYDWENQSGIISWRTSAPITSEHRVEIPEAQFPSGGIGGLTSGIYVGTPLSGVFRKDAALKLGVTSGTNPIINAGEDPEATWKIDVTYRLIKAS